VLESPPGRAYALSMIKEPLHVAQARASRVLIVDDHTETTELLRILLARRGFEVTSARSVATAIAAVEGVGLSQPVGEFAAVTVRKVDVAHEHVDRRYLPAIALPTPSEALKPASTSTLGVRGASRRCRSEVGDAVIDLLTDARSAVARLARRAGMTARAAVEGVVVEVDARSPAEHRARHARPAGAQLAGEAGIATGAAIGVIGREVDARPSADGGAQNARATSAELV